MKKFLLSFLLIFLFTHTQAQLLWKITGKDLPAPSYLFGTHHLIPIQFLDSVPGLFKAFNECETVIGEMVMNAIDATSQLQSSAILPDNSNLQDLMSTKDFELVDKELREVMGFGLKEVSILHPTFIRTMYQLQVYTQATGHSEDIQSDSYFQLVGASKGKQIIGLESMDKQVEVLLGNPDINREIELLVETVKNKDEMIEETFTLNELYRTGKIEELVVLAKSQNSVTDMTPEEYKVMVDDRNEEWMEAIPDYIKKSPCFIAVGAMHLGGEKGLVNLLKKAGYKVTPVKN